MKHCSLAYVNLGATQFAVTNNQRKLNWRSFIKLIWKFGMTLYWTVRLCWYASWLNEHTDASAAKNWHYQPDNETAEDQVNKVLSGYSTGRSIVWHSMNFNEIKFKLFHCKPLVNLHSNDSILDSRGGSYNESYKSELQNKKIVSVLLFFNFPLNGHIANRCCMFLKRQTMNILVKRFASKSNFIVDESLPSRFEIMAI